MKATKRLNKNSRSRQRHLSKNILLSSLIVGAGVTASPLYAAQSVIEEVLVTAQKREQDLQDVSVAVSAFSGDAIEKMGFEEGLDITQQVPNMNFFAIFGEASSPSVSLRGISLVNFSDSWESPVSIYVDDVYRGNPAGSAIQLFDLQRVEVLRGPQGTLYGRNTTGGLVHYVSRKPTEELDAAASVSYGSYDETVVEGMISGPLTDGIRGRVALKKTDNEGWQTNTVTGEKLNDTDSFGYRAQLDFDLTDDAGLLLNVHGSEADQQSVGFAHMGYLESVGDNAATCSVSRIHDGLCTSNTFQMTGAEAVNGQFDPEHVASGAADGLQTKIDTFGVSATLDWVLEPFTVTSITAYEELDKFLQDDGDGTEVVFFDEQYSVDAEQYTQELRLNGSTNASRWVGGVYYYKDDRGLITQAPTTADGLWHQEVVSLDSESWALFGQYEYDIFDEWTLILGARYTEEERDFVQDAGPSFYPEIDATRDFSDDALTGRIGLDWRPTDYSLAYVSLSTGFKSGGFSGSYNASEEATLPVNSEDVVNLEVGYKTSFADGRIKLNTAAFTYEVEGYQAQVFLTVADGSVITNAGDVTGTGAEVELTAQVTDNFELIGGLGLLKTEFDSDQVFLVAGDEYTLDGNELPSAPALTYNLVGRYYIPLGSAGELALQADYAWQDDHYLQIENDPYSKHDAYGIANAKVSWLSASERLTVEAFVKNATDEEYFTYQNTLGSDWGYGVWGLPRTAGVKVSWKM
ncbi:TonB-dependent receptor [Gilvimarinus agarilyticus]|uniref:TonB-dependent receptor n=1 Tax=Gilvimarinus agarilyticus TaxID=679259 RepID=UPI0005A18403|nr:TonB-dependent receptor [Gilvimarinus agarilyticus]